MSGGRPTKSVATPAAHWAWATSLGKPATNSRPVVSAVPTPSSLHKTCCPSSNSPRSRCSMSAVSASTSSSPTAAGVGSASGLMASPSLESTRTATAFASLSKLSTSAHVSSGTGGCVASHSIIELCSCWIRSNSALRLWRSSSFSTRASRSASSISRKRAFSTMSLFACVCNLDLTTFWMLSATSCWFATCCSICCVTSCNKFGMNFASTAVCVDSAKTPASRRCASTRSLRLERCVEAMLLETTFRMILRSTSRCAACCCMRRSISSWRRFSAASMRCTSCNSAFRRSSKSSWCLRRDSSSSSSRTSIMPCSSVLPTRTSNTGSHSMSKSNSSPSSICVSMSIPILAGMKSGDGGRSRRKSVCVSASNSTVRSVSSSKYESVWISMCFRPGIGSGVPTRFLVWFARMSRRRCASRCFCTWAGSGSLAGSTQEYVLPRTTRLSCMMLFFAPKVSFGSRYFFRDPTAWGAEANCCTCPCIAATEARLGGIPKGNKP
mmetsp:Transcript_59301/g.165572  ORF Transcript_59301/g.165572 Transcript_59301/m.165572 type:complete len:496 (+) Transcript_59301:97-1584(+)